jgi:hypothetical protein
LQREVVLDWFGGQHGFEELHLVGTDEDAVHLLVEDDFK